MPAVKTLTECSMRAILSNMDAVASLGTLPYRLAKPILMLMTPEKLTEIERNSPVGPLSFCLSSRGLLIRIPCWIASQRGRSRYVQFVYLFAPSNGFLIYVNGSEIWQNLCIQRFGLKPEGDDSKSPKSWRKFYHVSPASFPYGIMQS